MEAWLVEEDAGEGKEEAASGKDALMGTRNWEVEDLKAHVEAKDEVEALEAEEVEASLEDEDAGEAKGLEVLHNLPNV